MCPIGLVHAHALYLAEYTDVQVHTQQDTTADAFYIILAGSVRVVQTVMLDEQDWKDTAQENEDDRTEEHELGILNPGEGFGEMGLLLAQPRATSVVALSRSGVVCLRIWKDDYLMSVSDFHVLTNRYHDRYVL